MRKYIWLIALTIGLIIGAFATATFMIRRSPAPETQDTGPMIGIGQMIGTEHMIIAKQYDLNRQNDEWPSPDMIVTYLTSFDSTFTDRMGNRVDAYKVNPTLGYPHKYIVVGLFPNGYTRYIQPSDDLDL